MKGIHRCGLSRASAAIACSAATSILLSACLSDGDSDTHWVGKIGSDITVSGSVGDGPAINADVRIRSKKGEELATFKSDGSGSYTVDLKVSDSDFPLLVDATGGTDIVTNAAPDFVLLGAALSSGNRVTANVNPFSTFAYEIATDMNGGLTQGNLLAAEDIVVSSLNCGLTTLVNPGPMQAPVNAGNVAEMIKASETLAEVVRRTRDALNAAGRNTSADAVVRALGSDLIDTVIEGNGGPRADARTAAVANIVAAQVLLESMNNELHVNGVDATEDMRRAVGQVVSGSVEPTVDQLGVTAGMIAMANMGLSAAYAVTGDGAISDITQSLAGVQAGMEPSLVRALIPAGYRNALDGAVAMAASGDSAVIATINDVVRQGETPVGIANRAPTISGQPASSVHAGSFYDFTPTASDLDGDPLTFTIDAQPGWASFDPTTGRLSGTPTAANGGSYEGITITVSDGSLASNIGPFSITVTVDTSAPTISGTPPATIGVGERYDFQPSVSDPDSTVFRFEISGQPSWADFDVLTGELTGTPSAGDVGVYQNIEISVTDGTSDASLAPFSIEVVATGAPTGSVTLNWVPPTENEDGSQLVDLAGYRIYWSRDGGAYGPPTTISNPSVTRYVVENLTPGTYEFVATSFNSANVESRYSGAVTKVVQ